MKNCSITSRNALFGIANWALLVAGLVNLVVGTVAAVNASVTIAATSLTAGLILLFSATIDRFESVKGLGVEAKTRQLDQKLHQADEALRRLREMSEMTCAALIDLNSKTGRIGTAPKARESVALADRTRAIMEGLGSEAAAIHVALRPWVRIMCFDMARHLFSGVEKLLVERSRALEQERQLLPKTISSGDAEFQRLTNHINEISDFLSNKARKMHLIEIDEYPDKFMALFESAPQLERAMVAPHLQRAMHFADGMRSLRDKCRLSNPEEWIAELDNRFEND